MNEWITCRITSGMTKARLTDTPEIFPEIGTLSALKGDRVYLSLVGTPKDKTLRHLRLRVTAEAAGLPVQIFSVEQVSVRLPHYPADFDEDYLGHEPGLYPDLLRPTGNWTLCGGQTAQMLLELEVPKTAKPGTFPIVFHIFNEDEEIETVTATLKIIDACLPPQTLLYTQWLYLDCIASVYGVKAGVTGFLHWGYNFYYTQYSKGEIDPFLITDGDYFAPAGDTFSVYPGRDGTPLHSIRESHFYMGLADMRAMALAEKYVGRERVIREIERLCPVDFKHYPKDPAFPDDLRERINCLIAENLPKRKK